MKAAPLWRVSVLTGADAEDAVGDLLLTIFQQTASSYTDADTGLTETSVYVSDAPFAPRELRRQVAGGLKRIRSCGLKTDPGEIFFRRVKREDWALSWRRHFNPLAIGSALLVKPPWSRRRARKGQAVVVLNPGLSFGTGQHPTTEFCLRQLARRRDHHRRQSFLDAGTGSGILAIAAAKLGYAPVTAFDYDAEAVRIARDNARRNRVAEKINTTQRDLKKMSARGPGKFDVICANLIADLLRDECAKLTGWLRPGGVLIVAGILTAEFGKVRSAFENCGLKLSTLVADKEWSSGTFVRE